jgi:hypothetical protein
VNAKGLYVAPKQTFNLPARISAPESLASDDAEYSAQVGSASYQTKEFLSF